MEKQETKMVELGGEAKLALDSYAQAKGITMEDALMRAIGLQRFLVSEVAQGSTILIKNKNKTEQIMF